MAGETKNPSLRTKELAAGLEPWVAPAVIRSAEVHDVVGKTQFTYFEAHRQTSTPLAISS